MVGKLFFALNDEIEMHCSHRHHSKHYMTAKALRGHEQSAKETQTSYTDNRNIIDRIHSSQNETEEVCGHLLPLVFNLSPPSE